MSIASSIRTAEQLLNADEIGRAELVRGELHMMTPASYRHGRIAGELFGLIWEFADKHDLGELAAAETGFLLSRDPDTVRAADVAFVRKSRLSSIPQRGYFQGAPDVAVEVLSPNDTASKVLDKVQDWLHAGSVQVWVVDPERATLSIYSGRGDEHVVSVYGENDEFVADEPLKGFRLTLRDVL